MALSVFGKALGTRPALVKPRTAPPKFGIVLNKVPTLTRPLVAKSPIAAYSNRAFHPTPGAATSAAPDKFVHRAIGNVNATIRKPDRGAANVLQGAAIMMPDGTTGGSPVTPKPIQQALAGVFQKVVAAGGNTNLRQTQITTLARESYLDRQRSRDITTSIGVQKRGQFIQRRGTAYVARPTPSTLGALDKAKLWRKKFGTPTGVQGDRATNYPSAHVGAVYTKTVAPLSTNEQFIASRTGGTGLATMPTPAGAAVIANPNMTKTEAIGKAYAWAPADASADTKPSTASPLAGAQSWALLLGVGILGFMLIKSRS